MKQRGKILFLVLALAFILISLSNFSQAGTLKVTEEHPFLINGSWIPASDLKVGDELTTIDGKKVRITNITDVETKEPFPVYNLEAGKYHDFVVDGGDGVGVVVHNSDLLGGSGTLLSLILVGAILPGGSVCYGGQEKNSCSYDEDADTISSRFSTPNILTNDVVSVSRLNNEKKYEEIEDSVYSSLKKYKKQIIAISNKLGVDPRTVVSILYVEKVQYELNVFLGVVNPRKMKETLLGWAGDIDFLYINIQKWAKLSAGYAHIKPEHAIETKRRLDLISGFRGSITNRDTERYHKDVISSIKITAASLKIFQQEWATSPSGTDISNRPDILATCFNFGYDKVIPKPDPSPDIKGSTKLPVIVDGVFYEEINFGRRVEMIYKSKKMEEFFKK